MALRCGIDLVEIERLERLDPQIRQRFLRRVFTMQELDDAQDDLTVLAGRFAAKEAVAKALGCGIGPISWQDIEVQRGPEGQPLLHLRGRAAERAAALNLREWSISITHTRNLAMAMVVAQGPLDASPSQAGA
ncbi:holo-ACP synthase [uncultured Thermanaerothrix sp.]|uniref:holo-ACP synthase n=1 Tax=uncultured Thermanaerothrix sp. TaxID=1195149 RepID=UPI002621A3C7|nr:holo-ACP synthase [uncultured Thermanaerothrix sp.]